MPQPQYTQVIGSIPGRMLLEVPCICPIPEEMQGIAATLNQDAGAHTRLQLPAGRDDARTSLVAAPASG